MAQILLSSTCKASVGERERERQIRGSGLQEGTSRRIIPYLMIMYLLDVSGRPNTRDYGKALEALKLLTENVLRGPHNRVMGTTCL
jgi:hypothetical protein